MSKQKFIIVSNRLPISVSKQDGKLVYSESYGGLATAMRSIEGEHAWVGWPGIPADELNSAEKAAITKRLKRSGFYPVFLTKEQVDKFYSGYANDTIWPLFHYFQSYANYDKSFWRSYQEVNKLFQKTVVKHAEPEASIWVHDYHLMLLPEMIRKQLPGATIGFFLHIPFPSFEIFRLLPDRAEILRGLLGADLIGFHIYDYARHFLSSVLRVLGMENNHGSIVMGKRVVKVDAFPISIDYGRYVAATKDEAILEEVKKFKDYHEGRKIILSAGDRLDYSKGIMKRLEAFEKFLENNPSHHKKVVLVMAAAPTRTEVERYKELRDEVERAIARINGTYSTLDWTPISYQFKTLTVDQLIPMFIAADIALVTPLRDGMNIVAKEYVSVKQNVPGVLILSEMAGAVDELPEAVRINPNDIDAIESAIKEALKMPKKKQLENIRSMQGRISRYTVQRWARDFMEQLERSKLTQQKQSSKLLSSDNEARILRQFAAAKRRLLLLDYDGTLRSFVASHQAGQAAPPKALLALLKSLAALPKTKVCLISGRPRKALTSWFYGLPITLAAEHGAWMKYNGEWVQQQASMGSHKKRLLAVMEYYAERTPGAQVEQKDFALVWHYRGVPTELAHARNASLIYELNKLIGNTDLAVHKGAKIIEVKPRNVSKGVVAEDLMAIHKSDFVLAIGDDYTDEDMFRALPDDAHSIKVGLGDTSARYQVTSVDEVLKFLRKLAASS